MQPTSTLNKIAIYSRKSKFTEKGDSIDVQIGLCKTCARMKNTDLTDDDFLIFVDEGYSGKNTERPRFQAMMSMARKHAFQAVICYRIDRISRNIVDFHGFTEQLQKLDIAFVSVTENCDTSSPMGRAMLSICSVFAQLERETIADRIRDNLRELAKFGRWLGGIPPTGYKSTQLVDQITQEGKTRKAYKLDLIPEEAQLVKMVFEKFLETNALSKVETYCLQNHIKTKNGKAFTRFAIKNILQNPVYAANDQTVWEYFESLGGEIHAERGNFDGKHGIMAYNKTEQNVGEHHFIRDIGDWIIAIGKHEPLVSGETWVNVQGMLLQNKSKSYRKPKSNVALLSGLLYCGHCNSYMRPKLSSRTNDQGELIYNYLCETKEKSKQANCRMKNPRGNDLDEGVCRLIREAVMDQSDFRQQISRTQKHMHEETQVHEDALKSLRGKLQENEEAVKNLVASLATAVNTPAYNYITEEINKRHEQNDDIRRLIEETEILSQKQLLDDMQFDILRRQMTTISQSFDQMTIEEKRRALRIIVRKVVWDGESAHVYFFDGGEGEKTQLSYDGIVLGASEASSFAKNEPSGKGSKRNTHGVARGAKAQR